MAKKTFLISLILHFVLISLSPRLFNLFGSVPMVEKYTETLIPLWLVGFAHFDGINYTNIVDFGYNTTTSAFFPLYPLLIKLLTLLTTNTLVSGIIVSNVFFFLILNLIFKNKAKLHINNWFILLFLTYPTSFFLHSLYNESLYIYLLILVLLTNQNWLFLLLPQVRITGVFSLFLYKNKKQILLVLLSLAIFLFFQAYLFKNPFSFISSLKNFGEQRSGTLVSLPQVYFRYIKILTTSSFGHQYFIAAIEVFTFTLALYCSIKELIQFRRLKNFRYRLALFSILSLILPTLTGSFSSLPRYCLPILSQYYYLSNLKNTKIISLFIIIFTLLHIYMFMAFFRGYFVS